MKKSALIAAFAVGAITLFIGQSHAQFPAKGDDTEESLGAFRMIINPDFRYLMDAYPGYNNVTFKLQSPVLHDISTVIGRSDPHTEGSPADLLGTPVGSASTPISDAMITLWPSGYETGLLVEREVHTEVRSLLMMDLGGLGVEVTAGVFTSGYPITLSPGEVESKDPTGNPANDFPAKSFFNVYVEIALPSGGNYPFPGGYLYNPDPLLLVQDPLNSFPPRVVYIHENSNAVKVRFRDNDPGGEWKAHELFAYMVLGGHGLAYTDSMSDVLEFEVIMDQQVDMPLPADPWACCNHDGMRGDANYDMSLNVADLIYLVDYLFFDGPAPPCMQAVS